MTDPRPDNSKVVDPTANVLQLVDAAMRRQDDLRAAETHRQDDLRMAEAKRIDVERDREAGRVNALLEANTSNVALALEKQAAQAAAQDRRIAVLEQNQYQSGGRDIQRVEGTSQNRWTFQQAVTLLAIAMGALYFILNYTK